jgi:membrane protease YdiL (CAAX protease family)
MIYIAGYPADLAIMPVKPSTQHVLTIAYSLVLVLILAWLFNPFASTSQLERLNYVGESAGRMMDRHLAFYVGYEKCDAMERSLHRFLFGSREQVEAEAISTYKEVLQYFEQNPEHTTPWSKLNTQTRLFVTLAETGRFDELKQALESFDANPEEMVIAEAIRYAYLDPGAEPPMSDIVTGASLLPLGWAADHLRIRIAQKMGYKRLELFINRRMQATAERLRLNVLHLTGVVAALCILGIFLIWRYRLFTADIRWYGSVLETPWRFQQGVDVIIRSAVFGLLIAIALQMVETHYFKPGVLASWGTLFASLPMIWFIRQRLLKPRGISLRQAFGLSLCDTGWGQLVKVSLGFLAIEWLGTVLIGWLGWRLGVGSHWSDGVQERMIFGPSETVWLAAVNFILWAAIFEEIGFRGLLYTTLRKRLNMKLAIILSALIFSAMHLYSLAGFLSVFWSGMVLAYVYERYHSLLPGMIIHGASNLLSLSTVLLFYR